MPAERRQGFDWDRAFQAMDGIAPAGYAHRIVRDDGLGVQLGAKLTEGRSLNNYHIFRGKFAVYINIPNLIILTGVSNKITEIFMGQGLLHPLTERVSPFNIGNALCINRDSTQKLLNEFATRKDDTLIGDIQVDLDRYPLENLIIF